jgi:hypothetical protein
MPQPFVYIEDCRVHTTTEKALLIELPSLDKIWIPRSQLHEDCELDEEDDEGDLIIPKWLAKNNEIEIDGEYE